MSERDHQTLGFYERRGDLELGRGNVISTGDLATFPGSYPVYSSSAVGEGVFGRYGQHMFDEELITWSIDGGGRPFHRRKHRFSVTNVCGFLRVKRPDRWDYGYLHAVLEGLQSGIQFDYQMKAHPSVIRELYRFDCIPIEEQRRISSIRDTLDTTIRQTEAIIAKLKQVKQGLLHVLLTRGIDANGELRPPQSEAPHLYKASPLGWIPCEWLAKPLGEIADLQVGFAFKSEWFQDTGGVRLLRGDNVGYGKPDWSSAKFLDPDTSKRFEDYALNDGDIVVGMDRTFTKSGSKFSAIGAPDLPCLLVQRVGRFVAKACTLRFLRVLTLWPDFHTELMAQQKGMDIPHLSKTEILEPCVPVPSLDEQDEISNRIAAIEARIGAELQSVEKARLLKSGLMDDLLTGRVRVTPLLNQPATT